jgi:ATP-dependent DNA helicase HFM1/MER3
MKLIAKETEMKNTAVNSIRIIAASATLPNIHDVGEWLNVKPNGYKIFGNEFRPIEIQRIVLGYKNTGNPFSFEKNLNFRLAPLIK